MHSTAATDKIFQAGNGSFNALNVCNTFMKRIKTNYRRILSLLMPKSLKHIIKFTFTQNSNESGNVQSTMIIETMTSNTDPIPLFCRTKEEKTTEMKKWKQKILLAKSNC